MHLVWGVVGALAAAAASLIWAKVALGCRMSYRNSGIIGTVKKQQFKLNPHKISIVILVILVF